MNMKTFTVVFTDQEVVTVQAWDISSAYEFAQDIYGKTIQEIRP